MAGSCGCLPPNKTPGFLLCLRQQSAIAAAMTSTATPPTTPPTMVGILKLDVEPPDAVVVVWDGAEVVL